MTRSRPQGTTWSAGKVALWTCVAIVAFIGLVPAFWYWIAPAVSDLVAPVPVLAVIVGWLPVGGVLAALGFFMVIRGDLLPRTRVVFAWVLGVWGVLALTTIPLDVDSPPLDVEYYTGLRVGFLGALTGAVAVPLGVYLLWKPFHRRKEPPTEVWGCAFAVFAVVLLLLAAALSWLG
ncbi:hypothetical protein CLV43_114331 [Umezawaea tangerina]|uniref:Uncharacterized protein n=1 Tax=Umezawaea tangerina TaxID=84725 RepID=A0A2T0SPR2_9PSEU|nr:hypothetical protein CLV43_114331 [Umezawaea tangerina]